MKVHTNGFLKLGIIAALLVISGCGEKGPKEEESKEGDSKAAVGDAQDGASQEVGAGASYETASDMAMGGFSAERYAEIQEGGFVQVAEAPLSTFSTDVDTASYSNIRRFLLHDQMAPPKDAVRIEEMINYFSYDYPKPERDLPFSTTLEMASAPWHPEHRLLKIGLKGKEISIADRPAANLVFLVDVSGSMYEDLELLKKGLAMLASEIKSDDRIAIVTYAGTAGVVLPSTSDRTAILEALENLTSGGSTAGAAGIHRAYEMATDHKIDGGINRVILATDGDFNVGQNSDEELVALIEEKVESGIDLSVLGFGYGNLNDAMMEKLSNRGNGNYSYIDSESEAKKVLVEQAAGTLLTIAKDVKLQVEFNPKAVKAYRLIGYENRMLKAEDFNDDKKDAGDMGSGHTVTALYEVIPADGGEEHRGFSVDKDHVDPLVYQTDNGLTARAMESGEAVVVKLRYKEPDEKVSQLVEFSAIDDGASMDDQSQDFTFCAAVASFGMILRESPHKGTSTTAKVKEWATSGLGLDLKGYRQEFLDMVEAYERLP